MPELSLPDIRLPDIKLPEGLRDMNRQDIQSAIGDRLPRKSDLQDVDLSKVELPKAVEARLSQIEKAVSKIDLGKAVHDLEKAASKVELPKAVEDRLPGRKRQNRILPVAALVAVGSMIAAAWWLITSPDATMKVKDAAYRLRARITGEELLPVRYDQDADLGSLLPDPDQTRPSVENDTWPDTFSDLGDTVAAGNGSTTERPTGV
jgi:hypothetical protein